MAEVEPIGTRFLRCYGEEKALHIECDDAILTACGIDPYGGNWPFSDITYDDYDTSFEFQSVQDEWMPTREQLTTCFALGFATCWINYTDGTEIQCAPGYIGPRKPQPPRPYA